mgnify:CR=1 FL=1
MKVTRSRMNRNFTQQVIASEQGIMSIGLPRESSQFITVNARTDNPKVHEELKISFSREELTYLLAQFDRPG